MRGTPSIAPYSPREITSEIRLPVASSAVALSTSKLRPTATRAPLGQAAGFSRLPALTWNICASSCESGSLIPGCGRACAASAADASTRTAAAAPI